MSKRNSLVLHNKRPRVLVINSSMGSELSLKTGRYHFLSYPPVGLGYISHILTQYGIAYDVADMGLGYSRSNLIRHIKRLNPDIICVSMMSFGYEKIYKLISELKRYAWAKIIVGGPHVSCLRKEVLADCGEIDLAVVGEGEETLREILQGKDFGDIKGLIFRDDDDILFSGEREFVKDLDLLGFPRYERFELGKYALKAISIVTSRGCPYECIFCSVKTGAGRIFRPRSAESVIEELTYWYRKGYREFAIQDDNFTMARERVFQICEKIKMNGLKGLTLALPNGIRADRVDKQMLVALKDAGLKVICFGVEAGNNRILKNIKKGETIEEIEKAISLSTGLGLQVVLFFLIGSPGEGMSDLEDSFSLARRYDVSFANFYNPVPFPGTELFERMEEYGRFVMPYRSYLNKCDGCLDEPLFFETKELSKEERIGAFKKARIISREIHARYAKRYFKRFGFLAPLLFMLYYSPLVQYLLKHNKTVFRALTSLKRRSFGSSDSAEDI